MNWSVVVTVLKGLVSLAIVLFFVVVMAGGPKEVVRGAVVLADNEPFLLLSYTFCTVVATLVIYSVISLFIVIDTVRRH